MSHPPAGLEADCSSCFGLCCVALPFTRSADFATDKDAGDPCGHLRTDFRCGIHTQLRDRGFAGCTVFDCHGAGQKVSQLTYGGRDWREEPHTAREMFAVFPVMRQLHELLRYLAEALALATEGRTGGDRPDLRGALHAAQGRTHTLTEGTPAELLALDVAALRDDVNPLLLETSERVREAAVPGRRKDHRGSDLFGARLRDARLRGASLRGACLVAADLRRADLRDTDVIGADLRDADLRGADLTGALFLTGPQLQAARGDAVTRLPAAFARPAHWGR